MSEDVLVDGLNDVLDSETDDGIPGKIIEEENIIDMIAKNKIDKECRKNELAKKLDREKKNLDREKKKDKQSKFFTAIWRFISALVNPETYVSIIQTFENLCYTIFVDSLILFTIVSIVYIIYIAIASNDEDNIWILVFKMVCSISVAIICLIAQNHIPFQGIIHKGKEISTESDEEG